MHDFVILKELEGCYAEVKDLARLTTWRTNSSTSPSWSARTTVDLMDWMKNRRSDPWEELVVGIDCMLKETRNNLAIAG